MLKVKWKMCSTLHSESEFSSSKVNFRKEVYVDAISDGLRQSMNRYKDMVIMGQDISDYGGVFKVTEGFVDEFGRERVEIHPSVSQQLLERLLVSPLKELNQ